MVPIHTPWCGPRRSIRPLTMTFGVSPMVRSGLVTSSPLHEFQRSDPWRSIPPATWLSPSPSGGEVNGAILAVNTPEVVRLHVRDERGAPQRSSRSRTELVELFSSVRAVLAVDPCVPLNSWCMESIKIGLSFRPRIVRFARRSTTGSAQIPRVKWPKAFCTGPTSNKDYSKTIRR